MASELYKVSVPGSMMIMGEHAVLHGKTAIVCAVNKRLHMQLIPNISAQITITDTRLGTLTQNLNELQVQAPFKFVLQAIMLFKDQIPSGFTLEINSEFSSVIGLGSSAAVTIATVAVLGKWLNNIPLSFDHILTYANAAMLAVQGAGSGADLAASLHGGVLEYSLCRTGDDVNNVRHPGQAAALLPRSSRDLPHLTAIYCGYKTPTPEVIKIVNLAKTNNPEKIANIFAAMHECVEQAIMAIKNQDWSTLGKLFLQHHKLQSALGTSNQLLDELVQLLSTQAQIYGAKISGAGLGDCVIGLGVSEQQLISANDGMLQFPVIIDQQGLIYANN